MGARCSPRGLLVVGFLKATGQQPVYLRHRHAGLAFTARRQRGGGGERYSASSRGPAGPGPCGRETTVPSSRRSLPGGAGTPASTSVARPSRPRDVTYAAHASVLDLRHRRGPLRARNVGVPAKCQDHPLHVYRRLRDLLAASRSRPGSADCLRGDCGSSRPHPSVIVGVLLTGWYGSVIGRCRGLSSKWSASHLLHGVTGLVQVSRGDLLLAGSSTTYRTWPRGRDDYTT